MMMMKMLRHFLLMAYLGCMLAFKVIHAQAGFISLDCGIPENMTYVDKKTDLTYVSDFEFIENNIGESNAISVEYHSNSLEQQFTTIRSFPQGDKNCYTLKPVDRKGNKYLIRARFLYGNYDGKMIVPEFDLYLGPNKWGTVKFDNASITATKEIIYIPTSDYYIFVCLVNTGHGTPFISSLELRPLKNSMYASVPAAVLYRRLDVGSESETPIRYKDDVYDRIWQPFHFPGRNVLITSLSLTMDSSSNIYQPSPSVMATAMSPQNVTNPMFSFHMRPVDPTAEYYVYMHFAELEKLKANESREFFIYENLELWNGDDQPFTPEYLRTTTLSSVAPVSGDQIDYSLFATSSSTHQPILNALEVYIVQNFSEPQTHGLDVDAMVNIKSQYGVQKNWQGDPCSPKKYTWDGLTCKFNNQDPVRIISLNLSSFGLTGKITSHLSDLTMIQSLDLSNNNFIGSVPKFLSKLPFLKVLDLSGNKLTGSVPSDLIEKSDSGLLSLRVSGNKDLCTSLSCPKKMTKKYVVPVVASVASLLVLIFAFFITWRIIKGRKRVSTETTARRKETHNTIPKSRKEIRSAFEPKNHECTYDEIISITNNFEKIIGKGGFGSVFHGYLNDDQVAVKMLSESSAQGYKEFQAEVMLLMRVHHRNLTNLVGYCIDEDDKHMGLIYEYMANGNLEKHLSDNQAHKLSWEERLQIAVDAAQGLEYLHFGCKPAIVHRDVKTANILLNEKFQAKLADFGLSRAFSFEGGSQVPTTVVAGTPGYLDPEYYHSNLLNEKSDVYAFGVVLFEIITARPVIAKINSNETIHISQWVENMLYQSGEIKSIVDPRIEGHFELNSVWKAIEMATSCVCLKSTKRPTMNQVVVELKECLALEIAPKDDLLTNDSLIGMTLKMDTHHINPLPR